MDLAAPGAPAFEIRLPFRSDDDLDARYFGLTCVAICSPVANQTPGFDFM